MKLRAQLIVVSLLTLFLPWAGCTFVVEMESVLREGQQEALAAVAESVAVLLGERGGVTRTEPAADARSRPLYFFNTDAIPAVDGYPDAEGGADARLVSFPEFPRTDNPVRGEFLGMLDGSDAYVFIRIADTTIRYHNPAEGGVANGDHVVIAVGEAGSVRRYWLAPEAPGEFVARYRRGGKVDVESRIQGVWRDNADGYQLELRLPVTLLGDRFGFAAVDGDDASLWTGSMPPRADPGPIARLDAELTGLLDSFARDNLRLTIVDADGWVRARAGRLEFAAASSDERVPGTWILETLFRWIMIDDDEPAGMMTAAAARIDRDEVVAALGGDRASGWYRVAQQRGVAVASFALPIRYGDGDDGDDIAGVLVAEQSGSRVLSLTNAAVMRLLFLSLVATVLIGFGLLAYASLLSLRIRRLGKTVDAVLGDDGQIAGDFPERWARDEIGDLGRHFGHLLGRMREYNDYLQSLASKLSHELRTPLAVVGSSLDNLDHEVSGAGEDYVRRARNGVERLSRTLTAMSEASRVEQSIRSTEVERLELNALLMSNVDGYRQAFARAIECNVPDKPIYVAGSADLLAQMLDKLLANADDFCPPDGRIAVSLERRGRNAMICVDNDGPLLPAEMRGELFESMVSVRPDSQDGSHLGLGLTIARLVAEFHRGDIRAENLPDSSGVRFRITIPAA
ncbi:MAG: ATP-binding protein [Gammaproteobacteria bacterium]